jgi:Predicted membrane protein (DUF2306)
VGSYLCIGGNKKYLVAIKDHSYIMLLSTLRFKALFRLLFSVITLMALAFFWLLMLRIVLPYLSGQTDIDFLLSKQHIVHLSHYRWAFYLHIFSSLWLLASGLTQFSGYILKRRLAIHRFVGRVYVGIILLISGPAALVMACYANGGPLTKLSFIVLSFAWWACTLTAYRAVRTGDIRAHAAWMIRSYALTLSAITLRLMQFALTDNTGISPEAAYELIAWPSWLLNWFLAECLLARPGWFHWFYTKA